MLRIPSADFAANGSSRLAVQARRDSIGLPWPIAPTSKTGFGELTGDGAFPVKFAEAFGFGRANPTGTSDLVLSSPDGESGRPAGKGEGRGDPKGKLAVGRRSFGYFSVVVDRKVTRPAGRNQMLEQARSKRIDNDKQLFAAEAAPTTTYKLFAPLRWIRTVEDASCNNNAMVFFISVAD